MSKMVERVGIAICEAEIGGKLPGTLDDTGERSAAHWRKLARAAIKAMQQPTIQMEAAFFISGATRKNFFSQWMAAIREALRK